MYDSWELFCENERLNMKHLKCLPFLNKIEITDYEIPKWYNNDNYNEFEDESIFPIIQEDLNDSRHESETEIDESDSEYSSCDEYIDYY